MNKTTFKAHPLMLYRFFKPFLFVLVLPLIKGAVQYLIEGRISGVWTLEFIAFGFIFLVALFRTLSFSLKIEDDFLIIRNGFLLRRKVTIPKNKLSSISYRRNLADLIFRSVTFRLNTEAGSTEKADIEFKISRRSANELWRLLYLGEPKVNYRFSPIKIAALSASGSSFLTGLVVGVPVISYLGKLLGVSVERLLIGRLSELSLKINNYFPPILNLITLILLFLYGVSFVASLLKNIRFKLRVGGKMVETVSGLFVRRHTAFPNRRINCILIDQTPLMRLFGLYTMSAAIGGYGNLKGERPAVIPCGKKKEILTKQDKFFPFLHTTFSELRPKNDKITKRRFAFVPTLYYVIILLVGLLAHIYLKSFFSPVFFLCIVAAAINTYYLYTCMWEAKNGRLILSKNCSVLGLKKLSSRELNCESEKIAVIKVLRTPADRRYGTCKVKITVSGEGAESAKARIIDHGETLKRIEQILNKP